MILPVAALDDPRVDAFRRVGDHVWLRSQRLFVAEGRLLLERLVAAANYRIDAVLLSPTALTALRSLVASLDCPVYVAAQPLLNAIAGFNFHRGCLALAQRPEPRPIDTLFGTHRLLGLEGIGNPDNIGGLFRAAAAFGVEAVVLDEGSGDPFYRKALRTSMGAILDVPFARAAAWPQICARFREKGFQVAALVTDPAAITIHDFASRVGRGDRVVLLLGAEGTGLIPGTVEHADIRVTIPMASGVDSLNVAVACGVALSWVWRPRN